MTKKFFQIFLKNLLTNRTECDIIIMSKGKANPHDKKNFLMRGVYYGKQENNQA